MNDEQIDLTAGKIIEGLCGRFPCVAALYADGKEHSIAEAFAAVKADGGEVRHQGIRVEGVKSQSWVGEFMPSLKKDQNDIEVTMNVQWGEVD